MPRHISRVQQRWSDVDELGHVNNVVVLRYLQEARVAMLFADAGAKGTAGLSRGLLVHRHELDYLAPLHVRGGSVTVETWVRSAGVASFELGYEIVDEAASGGRRVAAVASTVLVPYDLDGEHPRRLDAHARAALEEFAGDGPAPGRREVAPWPDGDTSGAVAVECAVRFDDLDSYGHVNNVVIAEYLQQARIAVHDRYLDPARQAHERAVVAYQSLDYVRPIPFRTTPVVVDVLPTRVGSSSFDLAYVVRDPDGTVYSKAATTSVSYDVAQQRPRPLSDGERLALKELCAL